MDKLVLTLPYPSAKEERVFSLIRQNKADFESALSLDGTLAKIMIVKTASGKPCYKYEPSGEVLKCSKKATWAHNKEHCKKYTIFVVCHLLAMYIFLTFPWYFIGEL